jgi:chromosome segregation ATPase
MTTVERSAVNFALLQLIEGAPDSETAEDFPQSLALAQSRLELLTAQLETLGQQAKATQAKLETEVRVMTVIDEEYAFVQEQHRLQHAKVDELRAESARIQEEVEKVSVVVGPLKNEVAKLKLLVEGSKSPP